MQSLYINLEPTFTITLVPFKFYLSGPYQNLPKKAHGSILFAHANNVVCVGVHWNHPVLQSIFLWSTMSPKPMIGH